MERSEKQRWRGKACELGCRHWYFCAAEDAFGAVHAKKGHGGAVEGQVLRMWGLGCVLATLFLPVLQLVPS